MKKYITTISLVLNIVLVTLFFFFYNSFKLLSEANNVNLNVLPKSKSITNDATLSIIFVKIDSNFNLILTAITVLFTLFVFFKAGIKNFFLNIFKRAIVIYCLFFSLVFAIFVGATTLNFGTLVRYKIPCMPFYIIALIFILYYSTGKNKELKEDNALAD